MQVKKKNLIIYAIGIGTGIGLYICKTWNKEFKEDYGYKLKKFLPVLKEQKFLNLLQHYEDRNDLKIKWKFAETKVSYGEENPDKTFYVIRHCIRKGIFSMLNFDLTHLIYAEEQGYIPIIDERSFCNFMNDDSLVNKKNAWDMFLKQPGDYTLEDIEKSKNVILSNAMGAPKTKGNTLNWRIYCFKKDSVKWNSMFQEYYQFKPNVLEHIEEAKKDVFGDKKNVLGVALRRGIVRSMELGKTESNGHAIELPLDEIIEIVKNSMDEYKMDYVFCASDDFEALEIMKSTFGNRLLYLERERTKIYNNGEAIDEMELVKDRYPYTLAYITEILLLSKCDVLVAGRNGGSIAADVFNNGSYISVKPISKKRFYNKGLSKYVLKDGIVSIEERQ